MTVERWTDEMLDKLGAKLDQTHQIAESNARTAQALTNAVSEAFEMITQEVRERRQMREIILAQQAEIRGIQTENQRILDILLNDRRPGHDSEQER
jgi:fructose-1,6-bisphosphatase